MNAFSHDPQAVIAFWREAGRDRWFSVDPAFDAAITDRFAALHEAAAHGELDEWSETPEGSLALIVVLDQFPRNMFRGTPKAFATDGKALGVARQSLARGDAERIEAELRPFLAMPLMHSEGLADQQDCVRWMERIGPDNLSFAIEHRDIVERFGRFPHRNPILGRDTTPEERRFLDEGGFAG